MDPHEGQAKLQLDDRSIGPGEPCFIIAEAGVNHNGSLDMALRLVDVAVDAGADAVKFQRRDLPSLYPQELLDNANLAEWSFQYLLPVLRDTELSDDEFRQIYGRCQERGIRFMCTPWDKPSLAFLEKLGVDILKASSADLVNLPLLKVMAQTGCPLILSTGMATTHEIERTAEYLLRLESEFALLHCVSTYPAPFEGLNLKYIEALKRYGVPVGYSSHERGIAVPVAAVAMGASIIEKHITLDRTLPGPDHPASLEPSGIERMVRDIRNLELALGEGGEKSLNAMEVMNRQVLRKSLVAARDLTAGTVIEADMVKTLGPGKGLTPQRIEELIGVALDREIERDEYFTEGDIVERRELQLDRHKLKRPWGFKSRFHDLSEILKLKPRVVELHFSEEDVGVDLPKDEQPHEQQLLVHAPEFQNQRLVDFASEDEEQQKRSIELIQRTIDTTSALGAKFAGTPSLVIHVGGMSMDQPVSDIDRLLERAVESFRQLDAKDVVLLPENLPPRPWYLGGQWFQNLFTDPQHMVRFCEALDLGMTLDLSHAQLACTAAGGELSEFVELCLPRVRHVHIADASGIDGEGVQIGEGVIDWPRTLELLDGHDFTWVPEIWSGHLHHYAGFIEAVNRLATYDAL